MMVSGERAELRGLNLEGLRRHGFLCKEVWLNIGNLIFDVWLHFCTAFRFYYNVKHKSTSFAITILKALSILRFRSVA